MLSDASLVSGDSNAPAGGRAVVLRRHHHLRSVTSPQAPSPPLQVPDPPFPPQTPSPSGRGASWHITLFLLNPCCHSDLTSSSFSLQTICSSFHLVPCFFRLRYFLNLLLSTDFDIHSTLFAFARLLRMSRRTKEGTQI